MASAIGTGYDYSVSQYSPDGKLFQIEYAQKAVENSSTAAGMCCKNGVVLAVEKEISSKLYEKDVFNRIFHVDTNIGMAVAGLIADARQVVMFARKECKSHREYYGMAIKLSALVKRVSLFVHAYTTNSGVRPFGCSVLLAAYEEGTPLLFCVTPSGNYDSYHAVALGKDKLKADSLLEQVDRQNKLMDESVVIVASILHSVLEEPKPKTVEFELSFVGEFTGAVHQKVPKILHDRAVREATATETTR